MAVREKTREQRPSETVKVPPVSNTVRTPATLAQGVSKRPLVDAQKGDPAARARAAIAMQKQAGNARTGVMMGAASKAAEPKTSPKISVAPPTLVRAPTSVPQTVAKPVVTKEASKTIVTTTMSLTTARPQELKPGMAQPAMPVAGEKQPGPATDGKGPASPATAKASAAPAPEPSETPKTTAPGAAPGEKKDAKADGEKKEKAAEGAKGEATEEKEKPKVPSAREAVGPAVAGVRQRAKAAHAKSPKGEAITNAELSAKVPATEGKREAAAATVVKLGEETEKAPNVERQKFIDTLLEAIDRRMGNPKSESQAKHVMNEGAREANAEVSGHLAKQREATETPLREAASTEVAPTTDVKKVDFKPEEVGAAPKPVSAAPVVPEPLPDERLDYSSDREPTDRAMTENNISKEQLEKGNEPAFNKNLEERSDAEANEAKLATRYRDTEKKIQGRTHAIAAKELSGGLGEIHGSRELHVKGVVGQQTGTKDKGAAERTRITNEINGIKERTRTKVKVILQVMEAIAPTIFSIGLQAAEGLYSQVFADEKGGIGTWLTTWGDDWEELIENSLATAKSAYKIRVRRAISDVADFVDGKLAEARKAVVDGRQEVDTYVLNLADNVKQYGVDAQKIVDEDFAAMDGEIDSRRDALVEALVDQYKASYERMSAMEEKLREENKSIWQRIYDATIGLIKKIIAFKDMLVSILRKAAELIIDIITDPIGFLGNLIDGVMLGLSNFMTNLPRHLLQGLMKWLFGALGEAGLEMPESFDLPGIASIILQIFGLTYANFRKRAVDLVGEPVVAAIEKTADVFKVVMTEGIAGIWRLIKEKVLELKSMVLDAIFDFIKEKVLVAGVTWIIGLLNPVSAFFKACKAIYDIVIFFIERGSQIIDLVNAIIDSISAIVKGNISVAAKMVEDALAKAIPVAIGFLAALLGLGNISGTIRKTIDKAREPVNKAIDWVINLAVKGVKAAGKLFGIGKKKEEEKKGAEKETEELDVDQNFDMKGSGHSLHVEAHSEKIVVTMASERRQILENITHDAIIAEKNGANRADLIEKLEKIHEELIDLKWDWNAAHSKSDAEKRELIKKRINDIANKLKAIGGTYGIKDLHTLGHPSKHVEGNKLKEEFSDVRSEFYPSSYRDKVETWKANELKRLRVSPDPTKKNPDSVNPHNYFWCEGKKAFFPVDQATIDHKPWVVKHWNDLGGNNMSQSDRADFYNDIKPEWQVLSRGANSSDGHEAKKTTGGYTMKVGTKFLGYLDKDS